MVFDVIIALRSTELGHVPMQHFPASANSRTTAHKLLGGRVFQENSLCVRVFNGVQNALFNEPCLMFYQQRSPQNAIEDGLAQDFQQWSTLSNLHLRFS